MLSKIYKIPYDVTGLQWIKPFDCALRIVGPSWSLQMLEYLVFNNWNSMICVYKQIWWYISIPGHGCTKLIIILILKHFYDTTQYISKVPRRYSGIMGVQNI